MSESVCSFVTLSHVHGLCMPSPVPRSPAVFFLQVCQRRKADFGHELESASLSRYLLSRRAIGLYECKS